MNNKNKEEFLHGDIITWTNLFTGNRATSIVACDVETVAAAGELYNYISLEDGEFTFICDMSIEYVKDIRKATIEEFADFIRQLVVKRPIDCFTVAMQWPMVADMYIIDEKRMMNPVTNGAIRLYLANGRFAKERKDKEQKEKLNPRQKDWQKPGITFLKDEQKKAEEYAKTFRKPYYEEDDVYNAFREGAVWRRENPAKPEDIEKLKSLK